MNPIILPGSVVVDPSGDKHTVGAVGVTGNERYYWLVKIDCPETSAVFEHPALVSMFPADVVETWTVEKENVNNENQ